MNSTNSERQTLVNSPNASFPYVIEFRTNDEEEFRHHSRIQTMTDERVFVNHANPNAQYRIRRPRNAA